MSGGLLRFGSWGMVGSGPVCLGMVGAGCVLLWCGSLGAVRYYGEAVRYGAFWLGEFRLGT